MNQLCMTFTETRYRKTDCDTSKAAAKAAVTRKADSERLFIKMAVKHSAGLTAREVAVICELDYITVQRRISECGLTKTTQRRDGCAVWISV
jgi:hypothetical protein